MKLDYVVALNCFDCSGTRAVCPAAPPKENATTACNHGTQVCWGGVRKHFDFFKDSFITIGFIIAEYFSKYRQLLSCYAWGSLLP